MAHRWARGCACNTGAEAVSTALRPSVPGRAVPCRAVQRRSGQVRSGQGAHAAPLRPEGWACWWPPRRQPLSPPIWEWVGGCRKAGAGDKGCARRPLTIDHAADGAIQADVVEVELGRRHLPTGQGGQGGRWCRVPSRGGGWGGATCRWLRQPPAQPSLWPPCCCSSPADSRPLPPAPTSALRAPKCALLRSCLHYL
jgi:hypothetical protein